MLVRADQASSLEADHGRHDSEPAEEVDPSVLVPFCGETNAEHSYPNPGNA
ncbi:MAG: hypothetical protein ACRDRH_28480 [Pseudonocardia sp.]